VILTEMIAIEVEGQFLVNAEAFTTMVLNKEIM
jgi:hypothetical protein